MLSKFVSIKNIGRFLNSNSAGDVTLRDYNLIFAENGRGKTTLCAILRSLKTNDCNHIFGRKTLGIQDQPEVNILFDTGNIRFENGIWTDNINEIEIFDNTFISDNVFSGEIIGTEQRKNLAEVIVGKEGVSIARRINEIDGEVREKNREIAEARTAVSAFFQERINLNDFLKLEADENIEQKIKK